MSNISDDTQSSHDYDLIHIPILNFLGGHLKQSVVNQRKNGTDRQKDGRGNLRSTKNRSAISDSDNN